ncbi:MAG: aminopeptidase P family N-terminal domain-containing protein, partial [Sulfitobacter sp.]
MFQSFEVTARPEQGPPRLKALRQLMDAAGLDGFVVPRADAHQGEYVCERDARLAWLTGFTGSAGFCAVLGETAGVFIDGRYRTQVKAQVADVYTPVPWPEVSLAMWLRAQLPEGGRVGFDPWLHTVDQIAQAEKALAGSGITLVQSENLVDVIWEDQPDPPMEPAKVHPMEFAGETHQSKRLRLAETLAEATQRAAVITLPDSICWLLNIRGGDIERNPVVHGFAILHADGKVDLFAAPSKFDGLDAHLGPDVTLHAPSAFIGTLSAIEGPVRIDGSTVPQRVADALGDAACFGPEPCALPKARKNAAEIEGAAQAHLRDGAAMADMLCWLDAQPIGSITETQVVSQLEALRRRDNGLQDISFETIAGTGPNGAIMHYRVTEETDATLEDGQLIVLDSGG